MNHTNKVLSTDMDFLAAALTQFRVSVWFVLPDLEQIMDYGGVVESYSDVSVRSQVAGILEISSSLEF